MNKKLLKNILIIGFVLILIVGIFIILGDKPTFADSGYGVSYSGGGYSGSSSSSYGGDVGLNDPATSSFIALLVVALFAFFVIVTIVVYIQTRRNRKKKANAAEIKVKQVLENFDTKEFIDNGYKIYYDIQQAWMNFELDNVKDLLTNELYSTYQAQLDALKIKNQQNIMNKFFFKNAYLSNVEVENNTITISAIYVIDFFDYIIDMESKKVLRGSKLVKNRVTYEMQFQRHINENSNITTCPNCGAHIEINTSGTCSYCHSKLVNKNTNWVLNSKKVLKQQQL